MDEIDIWRSAAQLSKRHGTLAAIVCARRLETLAKRGDFAGEAVWKRIPAALRELQRTSRGSADLLH